MTIEYATYEYTVAAAQLALAMLGMGATLLVRDFVDIVRRPHGVGLVLVAQFILFPWMAFSLGKLLPMPPGVVVGLILVTAVPSGAISNILAYLRQGNVPLSITATTASTLVCLLVTPLILHLYAKAYVPSDFHMPYGRILVEIVLYMLLPLASGMIVGYFAPGKREFFSKWMVRGSLIALAALVVGSLTSGRIDLLQFDWWIPVVVILFGTFKISFIDQIGQRLGFSVTDSLTMAIEAGVRNCNLAVLLKASLFPAGSESDVFGDSVLFIVLFYGGASLVIASVPILHHRRGR